jgi:D-inositol-3-phosphate glycosyltransferase
VNSGSGLAVTISNHVFDTNAVRVRKGRLPMTTESVSMGVLAQSEAGHSTHGAPESDRKRRLSVGILVDGHLSQSDPIRKPNPDFLSRLIGEMSAKVFSSHQEVRGNVVAADTLIDAFIRHGKMADYRFFVFPDDRASVFNKLIELGSRQRTEQIEVTSIFDALHRTSNCQVEAWFNPIPNCSVHGGIDAAHRIRSQHASTAYPITALFHGLFSHRDLLNVHLQFLLRPTLACDSIVCTSRASRESAQKIMDHLADRLAEEAGARAKYNGRFDLVPLCVDTTELRPRDKNSVRRKLKLPQDAFLLLYVGRISLTKADLCPFMQAFQELVRKNPWKKIVWVIAGTEDQGYSKLVVERARELGIAHCVRVLLNISDSTKSLLYSSADVFVSPVDTLDESFGLTPIEAMSCGIPQVVPDWSGYRDTVIHGQTGFLVPTYWTDCCRDLTGASTVANEDFRRFSLGQSIAVDMQATLRHIQELLDNESLRSEMAERSRQRALSSFGSDVVVRQYEELWAELAHIANRLKPETKASSLDRLQYFNVFGNYASARLTDESSLQLTRRAVEAMTSNGGLLPQSLPALKSQVLDATILHQMLAHLMGQTEFDTVRELEPAQTCRDTVGRLVGLFDAQGDGESDYYRRHVMWLIKYAYLEPVT